jgi:hypothetical protein
VRKAEVDRRVCLTAQSGTPRSINCVRSKHDDVTVPKSYRQKIWRRATGVAMSIILHAESMPMCGAGDLLISPPTYPR